jgi:hypothetical protein
MSGILPSASNHPVWSPIAGEIHAVIWDRVGLKTVQGFVKEWASDWGAGVNDAEAARQEKFAWARQALHYPEDRTLNLIANNLPDDWQLKEALWELKLPELPLPPLPHRRRSPAEKWASLAALHDVYDSTGDTVLPWPLPEDDLDLVAFTEWFRGEAGAYQLLMRKASELPPDRMSAIRRWLTDVSKDTLPKESKSNDLSQRLERIEAMVATVAKSKGTRGAVDEAKAKKKEVEKDLCVAWETFYSRTHKSKAEFLKQETKWEPLIRQYFRDEMKTNGIKDILTLVKRIIDRN